MPLDALMIADAVSYATPRHIVILMMLLSLAALFDMLMLRCHYLRRVTLLPAPFSLRATLITLCLRLRCQAAAVAAFSFDATFTLLALMPHAADGDMPAAL